MAKNAANLGIEFSTHDAEDTSESVGLIRESLSGINDTLKSIRNINAFQAILDGFSLSKLTDIKDTISNTVTSLKDNVQMSSSLDSEFASARKSAKELANSMGLSTAEMKEMRSASSFAPALNMDMEEVQKTYATLIDRQMEVNDFGFENFKQFSKFIEVNNLNGQEYVETLNSLNKTFGLSKEQVTDLQDNVATISQEFGVGEQIMGNFGEITSEVGNKLKAVNGEATPEEIKSYTEQVAEMTGLFKETGLGADEAQQSAMSFTTSILESREEMKGMLTGKSGEVPQFMQNIATSQMGFNTAQQAMTEDPVEFVQRLGEQYESLSGQQKDVVNQRVFSQLDEGVRNVITSGNLSEASKKLDGVREKMEDNESAASAMAKSYDAGRTAAERLSFIEDNFEKQILDLSKSMGIQKSVIDNTRTTYGLITDNLKTFTGLQSVSAEVAKKNGGAIKKWGITLRDSGGQLTTMGEAVRSVSRLFVAFQTGGLYGVGVELGNLLEKYTSFNDLTDVVKNSVSSLSDVFSFLQNEGLSGVVGLVSDFIDGIDNLGPLEAFRGTITGTMSVLESKLSIMSKIIPNSIDLLKALWKDGFAGVHNKLSEIGVLASADEMYGKLGSTLKTFKKEALSFLENLPEKLSDFNDRLDAIGQTYPNLGKAITAAKILFGIFAGGKVLSALSTGTSIIKTFFSQLQGMPGGQKLAQGVSKLGESFSKSMPKIGKSIAGLPNRILSSLKEGFNLLKVFLPDLSNTFLGRIGGFFKSLGGRLVGVVTGVFGAGGAIGRAVTMLFTPPIGWVVAIMSGIGMITEIVENNFEDGWSGLMSSIGEYIGVAWNFIMPEIEGGASGFFKSLGNFLLDMLGDMVNDFITGLRTTWNLIGFITGWLGDMLSGVDWVNVGQNLVNLIGSGIKTLFFSIVSGITSLFEDTEGEGGGFLERFGSLWVSIGNALLNTVDLLWGVSKGVIELVGGILIGIFEPILGDFLPWALGGLKDLFIQLGNDMVNFDWMGFLSGVGVVFKNALIKTFAVIKSVGPIVGGFIQDLWAGLKSHITLGWDWFKDAGMEALEVTINFGLDVAESFAQTFVDAFETIRVAAITVWENIKLGLKVALMPIKHMFLGLVDMLKYKVFGPILQTMQGVIGQILDKVPDRLLGLVIDTEKWRGLAEGGMVKSALGDKVAKNLEGGVGFNDIIDRRKEQAKSDIAKARGQKDLNIALAKQGKPSEVHSVDFDGDRAKDRTDRQMQDKIVKSDDESKEANKKTAQATSNMENYLKNIDDRESKRDIKYKTGTDDTSPFTNIDT